MVPDPVYVIMKYIRPEEGLIDEFCCPRIVAPTGVMVFLCHLTRGNMILFDDGGTAERALRVSKTHRKM